MDLRFSLLLPFLLGASLVSGQVPTDSSFQVSPAQTWTDTGLELQPGEALEISAAVAASSVPDRHAVSGTPSCDPKGLAGASSTNDLPLPSAPAGALIARLQAQGAAPLLVGEKAELSIKEPSHLFLGMNAAGTGACQGALEVKVHRVASGSGAAKAGEALTSSQAASQETAAASSGTNQPQQSRGQQLKSQLANAASVFMAGQFGINKNQPASASSNAASSGTSTTAATPAVTLNVSQEPLDSDLRKQLDTLPRRVNDQFQNQGDMVNFVIVGSQKDVQAALDAASWHVADIGNQNAVVNAVLQTYAKKDYLTMPMSTLFLFGRKQDFGYEMAEPIAMVASRHHFRIWKAPFTWKGSEVWVGAGTHDIGFAKDQRNGSVTHKIDPAVDGERDNIGSSLQKATKTKTLTYYLPPNPVQEAKNATGDGYHSDGRLLVIFLQ